MLKFSGLILRSFAVPKQLFERPVLSKSDALFVRQTQSATSVRELMQKNKKSSGTVGGSGALKWILLVIPVSSFGLGCWQVQRLRWKVGLIDMLKERAAAKPVELPEDLNQLESLEFCPIKVRGKFLHDKEVLMGPRSRIEEDGAAPPSGSFMSDRSKGHGYMVVTPFKLSDRDLTILVNRGWVPHNLKHPSTRIQGQVNDELELTGVVRLNEKRAPFVPNNKPLKGQWFYRNLEELSELSGSAPVWLDARGLKHMPDGWPIPNQTRVTLRNEHMAYILTWFGLSAVTSFMWFKKFGRMAPKKFCV